MINQFLQADMLAFDCHLFAQIDSADQLGATPFVVLGGYLLLLLALGFAGWMRSRVGVEDYYLAGREQGWLVSSLTIMATFFSSFALLGAPGMVYREGVVFALFSLNVPVAGLSVYLLGSRIWKAGRTLGYVTPGDMVSDYYGSRFSLRVLVAVAGVLYAIPYVVMQIQAGGLLSQKLFGEDSFEIGAILLAGITTLYIMIGGMRSVAWTDLIQGLLLFTGMLVSGFAMFLVFDGPADFSEQVTSQLPESALTVPGNTGTWTWPMLFTVCLFGSVGSMVQPAQWMRFYSAKSISALKRASVIFAVVLTTCFLLGVMLIGMAGQVFYPPHEGYLIEVVETDSSGEIVTRGPDKLEGNVPPEFADHFRYLPPANDVSSGHIVWSWPKNISRSEAESPPRFDSATAEELSALSDDSAYRIAVASLRDMTEESIETTGDIPPPRMLPHPRVDPNPAQGQDFDSILVVVLRDKLPNTLGQFGAVFAALIIVAIMAASMSTADSNLHALSAVLTRDVYDQFIRPQASERERVWVGRLIIVAATVVSLVAVIATRDPSVSAKYRFMNMIAEMGLMAIAFSAQLLPLTVDMLFLQKGTGRGAACGLAAGLFITYLFGPLFGFTVDSLGSPELLVQIQGTVAECKFANMHGSVWGLVVNVLIFVLVSFCTKRPSSDKIAQYRTLFSA